MNTKQIDAVLELAKTLNFSRAAEKLCISQPSLSYEIKSFENEIGFKLFDRSGKGAMLTPAGNQFCVSLRLFRENLKNAIEQGQNFSTRYSDTITIGLPVRSMLKNLPQKIIAFNHKFPEVSISPVFIGFYHTDDFLQNKIDALVAMDFEIKHIPDIKIFPLYECGISLLVRKDDPLAVKKSIQTEDLRDRTLMVGGGSPPALQRVQQRLIRSLKLHYFNSSNHDTTLTYVAARKGVCLSPDFFSDDEEDVVRIPFICPEKFHIVLCTHENDKRDSLSYLVTLLQNIR